MASLTWFITGASSGFGQALALEALNAGHRVIGTTRDVEKAQSSFPEFETKGGSWLKLDPGDVAAYDQVLQFSKDCSIDVVVNNAGYAFIGGIEDTSENEVRSQMEVNFYGPLRIVRALLPSMREKQSGNIVLISSGAGLVVNPFVPLSLPSTENGTDEVTLMGNRFIAKPARGTYSASKFAIEAIHEALSQEVETFGIKVLIVEPGAFRTPFASRFITPAQYASADGFSEVYRSTAVAQTVAGTCNMKEMPAWIKGHPGRAARAILGAVENGHEYLRLPLGSDCVAALEGKILDWNKDLEATRRIATSTDVD